MVFAFPAVTDGAESFQVQAGDLLRREPQPVGLPTGLLDLDLPLQPRPPLIPLLDRPHVLDTQLLRARVVLIGDLPPMPLLDFTSDLLETVNHVLALLLAFLFPHLLDCAHPVLAQPQPQRLQEMAFVPALGFPEVVQPLRQPLMLLL